MSESKQSLTKSFFFNWCINFCCITCAVELSGLIFLPESKEFRKKYSIKRYCSFSVASRPKRSGTKRRHYLHWHKRFWHQQKIIYCRAYTENEEAWLVQMQLAAILFQIQCILFIFITVLLINLQYKLDYDCQSRYLLYRPGKNQKLCISRCWKPLLKSPFFYTGNRSSCHLKEEWAQNSMM